MLRIEAMREVDRVDMADRHEQLAEENEAYARKSIDPKVQRSCLVHAREHRRKARLYLQLR